jgi:hypothetical protein
LKLDPALTLRQNPIFEMASKKFKPILQNEKKIQTNKKLSYQ